jgi:hypothetical protein
MRECYLLLLYYLKGADHVFPPMFGETKDLDVPAKLRREEVRVWLQQTGKWAQVTDDQIDRHATEVGIERQLGQRMKVRIRRFSELLLVLEKLAVVRFGAALPFRSLFGFDKMEVLMQKEWKDAIIVASDSKYFGSLSSVYEMLKMFGFKCLRSQERVPRQAARDPFLMDPCRLNKKADIVLSRSEFRHDPETLRKNIPRYCNANQAGLGIYTKEQSLAGGNALYALADAVLAHV